MGYMKIPNLYKAQDILLFRECYALEKIHGTSANVRWKDGGLRFYVDGAKHESFVALFDADELAAAFAALGHDDVTVYGEAYGGKVMKMRDTYGDDLQFIAFEVRIGDLWLGVTDMHGVATSLGLEVVPWREIPATVDAINAERDRPSEVAARRGCGEDRPREGVVLRPPVELTKNNGERVIAKHKSDAFRETHSRRKVSKDKLQVLTEARAIAEEWVTPMRLAHVLDSIGATDAGVERTGEVIKAMIADVEAEAGEEAAMDRNARKAVGHRAARLFKDRLEKGSLS